MTRSVCLVSRQRLIGETNGSSNYILSIAKYLASRGMQIHYVCPTPAVFGRWPYLRLRDEMDVFASYRIRGSVRLGRFVINPNLAVLGRALIATFDVAMARLGAPVPRLGGTPPNPFHEFTPLDDADIRYLRKTAEAVRFDAVLCDYAVMTPAIAHLARPGSPSAVVMHDLYNATYPSVDATREFALLGLAGLVVAIQQEEAAAVQAKLPGHPVVVAPMAIAPAASPAAGDPQRLLFVASQTKPNIEGLDWFVEKVWPALVREKPGLTLDVAGTVARGMGPMPRGVRLLGLVPNLDELYRQCGIVISPLRSGTGLKIKLIEAMSRGKAVVATPVTVQGVEDLVAGSVAVADEPDAFAHEILHLADREDDRASRGAAGLRLVREHFNAERCYSAIHEHLAAQPALSPA